MNIANFFDLYYGKTELNNDEKQLVSNLQKELTFVYEEKNKQLISEAITVRDLFWKTNFEDVYNFISANEWVEEGTTPKSVYSKIFNYILSQPLAETPTHFIACDFENSYSIAPNVYSLALDDVTHLAFDFIPYSELANYFVHPNSIKNASSLIAVAAGILEEFSWNPLDEDKEVNKDSLLNLSEEVLKSSQDKRNADAVSSEIESLENSDNVINFFSLGDDEEDIDEEDYDEFEDEDSDNDNEVDPYPYSNEDGFLLREIISFYSFKELENTFIDFALNSYDFDLKVDKDELPFLFSKAYFKIKSELSNSKQNLDKILLSSRNCDFFYYQKDDNPKMSCIITGLELLEYIDCRFNDRFGIYSANDVFAFFVFSLLSADLTFEKYRCAEDVTFEFLMKKLKDKKEFSFIVEKFNNLTVSSFSELTLEEIELLIYFTFKFLPKY